MKNTAPVKYCGRDFSSDELERIRDIIAADPQRTRAHISRLVCQALNWYKPDGGLKDMSCRVALLRMQENELITLPAPRHQHTNRRSEICQTSKTDPKLCIAEPVNALPNLSLQIVSTQKQSDLWREYIHRYHYLGYTPLPGAQVRYMVVSDGEVLALLGFSAAAWKTAPRDQFVGWSKDQQEKNLHLIANNARFLILPWVKSKNLASKILAMTAKRLPEDWNRHYGYSPVLLETFVESNRFRGTCYQVANWIHVGRTKGRGKLDVYNTYSLPQKEIWLYPLTKKFKKILCNS